MQTTIQSVSLSNEGTNAPDMQHLPATEIRTVKCIGGVFNTDQLYNPAQPKYVK